MFTKLVEAKTLAVNYIDMVMVSFWKGLCVKSQSVLNNLSFLVPPSTMAILVMIIPVWPRVVSHSFSRTPGAYPVLPDFVLLTYSYAIFAFSFFNFQQYTLAGSSMGIKFSSCMGASGWLSQ